MGGPIDLDPVDRLVWRFDHFHVSTILHRTPCEVISSKFMALFMQLGTAVNQSMHGARSAAPACSLRRPSLPRVLKEETRRRQGLGTAPLPPAPRPDPRALPS